MDARPVLVFDVAETLLDLRHLEPVFARVFGDAAALRTWFDATVVHLEALTFAGLYESAGTVAVASFEMLARARGVELGPEDVDALKGASATMPACIDVPGALARLRDAGFRMVALSNHPRATYEAQLVHAGIRPFFERLFSIDDAPQRYKPAPETYLAVAEALGVAPSALTLVSCHAFDTLGAAAAGLGTALVLRPGNAPFALGPQPDLVVPDLDALATALVERYGSNRPLRGDRT